MNASGQGTGVVVQEDFRRYHREASSSAHDGASASAALLFCRSAGTQETAVSPVLLTAESMLLIYSGMLAAMTLAKHACARAAVHAPTGGHNLLYTYVAHCVLLGS